VTATTTPAGFSPSPSRRQLNGISEIRTVLSHQPAADLLVGPTAFNLLGIDRWVRNFQYIAYYDLLGRPASQGVRSREPPRTWGRIRSRASRSTLPSARCCEVREAPLRRRGGVPMIAMVFFDEETEQICQELGYDLILPPDSLRASAGLEDRNYPARQRGGRAPVSSERCWARQPATPSSSRWRRPPELTG